MPIRILTCLLGLALPLIVAAGTSRADDWPSFRGPARDGKSAEDGLLQEWPDGGPKRLLIIDTIGTGYGSPAVVGGKVFIVGNDAKRDYHEIVACYDAEGKRLWEFDNGPSHRAYWGGSRCTPTVAGSKVFLMSSAGRIAALSAGDGKELWTLDIVKQFKGVQPSFSYSESLLATDGMVICTPGGDDGTVAALAADTGKAVWVAKLPGELAVHSSAVAVEACGVKQMAVGLSGGFVGLRAKDGDLLWRWERPGKDKNVCNGPVWSEGLLAGFNSYNATTGGAVATIEATKKNTLVAPRQLWETTELSNHCGGCVIAGGRVYGKDDAKSYVCLDAKTGKLLYRWGKAGYGAVVWADGRLYCWEDTGTMELVEPADTEAKPRGLLKIDGAGKENFAPPAISGGKLYIRCGASLTVWNIRRKSAE